MNIQKERFTVCVRTAILSDAILFSRMVLTHLCIHDRISIFRIRSVYLIMF